MPKSKTKIIVPVEFTAPEYSVKALPDGRLTIQFEGQSIPSLPGVEFGFSLEPGTTRKRADELCAALTKLAPFFFAGFLDQVSDAEFQRYLIERYDEAGYLNPDRPLGPGDALKRDDEPTN